MLHTLLLVPHVAAGAVGLALGPLAMLAPKWRGRHTRLGLAYQASVAVLCVSALGLAALAPARLAGLAVISVLTEAAALVGWGLARHRPAGWLPWHIRLICGSYVSFVTAFLVVTVGSPVAWLLPTVVASPLIARASGRAARPAGATASVLTGGQPSVPG